MLQFFSSLKSITFWGSLLKVNRSREEKNGNDHAFIVHIVFSRLNLSLNVVAISLNCKFPPHNDDTMDFELHARIYLYLYIFGTCLLCLDMPGARQKPVPIVRMYGVTDGGNRWVFA